MQFDSVIDWQKYLESNRKLNGRLKTPKELERDRKKLAEFWEYAKRRGQFLALLKSGKSEAEIAKILGMSKLAVRRRIEKLMPERLAPKEHNKEHKKIDKLRAVIVPTRSGRSEPISYNTVIANVLKTRGVSYKSLLTVYRKLRMSIKVPGQLFTRILLEKRAENARELYKILSKKHSEDFLVLLEIDRLWARNAEKAARNPQGMKNLAIKNLREMGVIK